MFVNYNEKLNWGGKAFKTPYDNTVRHDKWFFKPRIINQNFHVLLFYPLGCDHVQQYVSYVKYNNFIFAK